MQTFGYDGNGNRTSLNGGGSYASNNLNQYTTFNGLGATYDLNGNLKTYPPVVNNGWTYIYDAQNRLTTVKQGTTTVAQYWYDGLNRQITRNVNGAITFHVWDGWNLIEERGTGNALQNIYLYAGDQIIENVTTKRFYFQDSLGNTTHLSDEAGNLLERYTYSAFGLPTFLPPNSNSPRSTSAFGIRHLFQGQLWTQETGLNDYRNRAQLPSMGVFLQPDPIGFKGDAANLYRFCTNNAVNRTDPDGLISVDATWSRLMHWQGHSQYSFNAIAATYRSWQPAGMDGGDGAAPHDARGQRDMAGVAEENEGSTKYRNTKNWRGKDVFHCNEFVADMAEASGRTRPQVWVEGFPGGFWRDPVSNELADPNVKIPRWSEPRPLSEARRNDIIAQRHGKWGHTGIVTGPRSSISVNTDRGGVVEKGNWGFRPFPDNGEKKGDPPPVVRHYLPGSSGDW